MKGLNLDRRLKVISSLIAKSMRGDSPQAIQKNVFNTGEWKNVQQKIGLQMGLFAFTDPPDDTIANIQRNYHYLSGITKDDCFREHAEFPYLIPNKSSWEDDPHATIKQALLRISRDAELKNSRRYPLFIEALRHPPQFSRTNFLNNVSEPPGQADRLSECEINHDVIFAPCGELSFFILGWLLRRLLPADALNTIRHHETDDSILENAYGPIQTLTEEEKEMCLQVTNSNLVYPVKTVCNIIDILQWLGLLSKKKAATPRFCNMIAWIAAYVEYYSGSSSENAKYFKDTQFKTENSNLSLLPIGDSMLTHAVVDQLRQVDMHGHVDRIISTEYLFLVLKLAISDPTSASEFRQRIRFIPEGHLALRAYESFERSWVVFPVLIERNGHQGFPERTGFFLGTINSSVIGTWRLSDRIVQIENIRSIIQPAADAISRFYYWPVVYRRYIEKQELVQIYSSITHEFKSRSGLILNKMNDIKHIISKKEDNDSVLNELEKGIETIRDIHGYFEALLLGITTFSNETSEVELRQVIDRIITKVIKENRINRNIINYQECTAIQSIKLFKRIRLLLQHIIIPELLRNALRWVPLKIDACRVTLSVDSNTWNISIANDIDEEQYKRKYNNTTQAGIKIIGIVCSMNDIQFSHGFSPDNKNVWEIKLSGGINA